METVKSATHVLVMYALVLTLFDGSHAQGVRSDMSRVRPGGQLRPAVEFHMAHSLYHKMHHLWPASICDQGVNTRLKKKVSPQG